MGFRYFFSTLGAFIAVAAGFGVYFASTDEFPVGQFNAAEYPNYALMISIAMAVVIAISAMGTQRLALRLYQPTEDIQQDRGVFSQLWLELTEAMSNYSFRWVFFGLLLIFLMVGVDVALNLYMNTFYWEFSSTHNLMFFVAAPLGVMVGTFFTGALTARIGKLPAVVWGVAGWMFC